MAAWIKMSLGMEVGLSPGDFVLDGDPAPLPKQENSCCCSSPIDIHTWACYPAIIIVTIVYELRIIQHWTSDRTQSSWCLTNGTRSLPDSPTLVHREKNSKIHTSFIAMPVCLCGRMNWKFTVAKSLSKNQIYFPGL